MDKIIFNYKTTIVQHTCKDLGTDVQILENCPFMCEPSHFVKGEKKLPYFGIGAYFWDNNQERAHFYGSKRYGINNYVIVEGEFILNHDVMLDLVASREDLIMINDFINYLREERKIIDNWTLSEVLAHLKLSFKLKKVPFPYKFLRVIDIEKTTESITFNQGTEHYTFLDPCIIICVFEKTNDLYKDFKILYRPKKQ